MLCSVLSDEPQVFPAELGNVGRPAKKVSTVQVVDADAENDADDDLSAAVATAAMEDDMAAVTTKKTPNAGQRIAGETYLDVKVSKIGLKDASVYTNPTVVVSVFGGYCISNSSAESEVSSNGGQIVSTCLPCCLQCDSGQIATARPWARSSRPRSAAKELTRSTCRSPPPRASSSRRA